jgi:hypothetical protein
VKVNVDASFDADRLQGTLEVVPQTAVTSDLLQRALLNLILDVMSVEAHAVKQELILAQTMGCNRIIVSSDCLEVVNIMKEEGYSNSRAT